MEQQKLQNDKIAADQILSSTAPSSSTLPVTNLPPQPSKQQVLTSVHWPTDEGPQLASQAKDMASLLQSDAHSSELGQRLLDFAKDVATLEDRAASYQSVIQKQQVQIQQLEESSGPRVVTQLREEIKSLKEENENLMKFVNTAKEPGWVTASHAMATHTPSMLQYPDSPLMKRIDSLQEINAKLFRANKDWHSKWELLRQSNLAETKDLTSKLRQAESAKENLKADLATTTAKLQHQMTQRENCEVELLQQKNLVERLRTEERRLAEEIRLLKTKGPSGADRQQDRNMEIDLLKQQLAVFMQDFKKETKEKQQYQARLKERDREREELRTRLELRIRRLKEEMTVKDDRLMTRGREIEHLQFKMVELHEELEKAKEHTRRGREARNYHHYNDLGCQGGPTQASASVENMASLLYPSSVAVGPITALSSFAVGPRKGPEEMPGAWTCSDCTYINYADRTVCDICGLRRSLEAQSSMGAYGELQSRGPAPQLLSMGLDVPDSAEKIEVDAM